MNKVELIRAIAEKANISKKDSEKALLAFTSIVTEALTNGEKVSIVGFGAFETRERAEKAAYNPVTKKKVTVAAKKVPAFKAGKSLKETILKV